MINNNNWLTYSDQQIIPSSQIKITDSNNTTLLDDTYLFDINFSETISLINDTLFSKKIILKIDNNCPSMFYKGQQLNLYLKFSPEQNYTQLFTFYISEIEIPESELYFNITAVDIITYLDNIKCKTYENYYSISGVTIGSYITSMNTQLYSMFSRNVILTTVINSYLTEKIQEQINNTYSIAKALQYIASMLGYTLISSQIGLYVTFAKITTDLTSNKALIKDYIMYEFPVKKTKVSVDQVVCDYKTKSTNGYVSTYIERSGYIPQVVVSVYGEQQSRLTFTITNNNSVSATLYARLSGSSVETLIGTLSSGGNTTYVFNSSKNDVIEFLFRINNTPTPIIRANIERISGETYYSWNIEWEIYNGLNYDLAKKRATYKAYEIENEAGNNQDYGVDSSYYYNFSNEYEMFSVNFNFYARITSSSSSNAYFGKNHSLNVLTSYENGIRGIKYVGTLVKKVEYYLANDLSDIFQTTKSQLQVGSGSLEQVVSNAFISTLSQASLCANYIYDYINKLYEYKIVWRYNPMLQIGDKVGFMLKDGTIRKGVIISTQTSLTQGMKAITELLDVGMYGKLPIIKNGVIRVVGGVVDGFSFDVENENDFNVDMEITSSGGMFTDSINANDYTHIEEDIFPELLTTLQSFYDGSQIDLIRVVFSNESEEYSNYADIDLNEFTIN